MTTNSLASTVDTTSVLVATSDAGLCALDATSGAPAWWRDLPDGYLLIQAP
ncbi:MAG TPA: hypothetical protein VGR57_10310 [Ktedonobacterales bacterium]|nr:hypothetical protein [Ktedonobacterales bacterium]